MKIISKHLVKTKNKNHKGKRLYTIQILYTGIFTNFIRIKYLEQDTPCGGVWKRTFTKKEGKKQLKQIK